MKTSYFKREARIPFTPEGHKNLLKEQADLLNERPDAVENLHKARDMGDLSENGYYKEARARLSFIDFRLRQLARLVKLAQVVQNFSSDTVQIGSKVLINNGKMEIEYTIVGSFESDPQKKTISHLSPLGKALIGKRAGEKVEVVTPGGVTIYTIIKII